jgi:hypothetical protein
MKTDKKGSPIRLFSLLVREQLPRHRNHSDYLLQTRQVSPLRTPIAYQPLEGILDRKLGRNTTTTGPRLIIRCSGSFLALTVSQAVLFGSASSETLWILFRGSSREATANVQQQTTVPTCLL